MEIQGRIQKITQTESFGANGFKKRELILVTEEQYPQTLPVEFVQDKTDLLNNFSEGQDVKIGINLRGKQWTSPQDEVKYFISLQGWKIELA